MEHLTFIELKTHISSFIILVVATPFLVFFVRNFFLSLASKNWTKVIGTITTIHESPSGQKFGLEYQYAVRNHNYKNRCIFYSNNIFNRLSVENGKKYTENQIVDVFYNPKKPRQAVLEPGRTDGALLRIVVLGIIVLYGLFAVFAPNLYAQIFNKFLQWYN